jgi:hypothetical protein
MGIFTWLRTLARNAVLQGVQDAATELQEAAVAVPAFRLTLTEAKELPEPEKRKARN